MLVDLSLIHILDGLATSVTTIIVACLTVIGVIFDVKEIIIFGTIVCGCNLAFLIFNLHPAKMFMGDTGSLMLGEMCRRDRHRIVKRNVLVRGVKCKLYLA